MTECSADDCVALRISGKLTMREKAVASSTLLGMSSNDITLAFTLLFCARMIGNSVRVAATIAVRGYMLTFCLRSNILGERMWLEDRVRFRCTLVLGIHVCEGMYMHSLIPQRGWLRTITSTDGGMVS